MNPLIKKIALLGLGSPFSLNRKLSAIRKGNALTILNLHRVAEDDGSTYRPLNPHLFDQLLIFLKKNFKLITFGQLKPEVLTGKPRLILSFDDGYKDFIENAVPILKRHNIRVNQNIIPECVERELPPLNVMAQDFIGKAPLSLVKNIKIPGLDKIPPANDRIQMGLKVSNFIKNNPMSEQRSLGADLLPQFYNWDGFNPTAMMSQEEITQLMNIHEFGAHSYSHASMEFETDDYFQEDLRKCRDYFSSNLKSPVNIYTFPNGSYRENQLQMALQSGYNHILLVNDLFTKADTGVYNRFGFEAQSKREVLFRALGGLAKVGVD
jgi:peptidoglycan/xylan/chitin deacetylase (PgdA/CDA1 family)